MKISEEKFNKLSQLDRIEYRQKEDRIRKKYEGSFLFAGLYGCFVVVAYYLLMIAVGYGSFGEEFAYQLAVSLRLISIYWLLPILIILFIADMIQAALEGKASKKLNEEFFKVEVKKK